MKKQSGFTLIELMVVMAIVAILATAGLSAYTNYIKGARDTARLQVAKQIGIKVEQLSSITGAPTPTQLINFLNAEGFTWNLPTANPLVASLIGSFEGLVGMVFADLPDLDPLGGKPVCYNPVSDSNNAVCKFSYILFTDGTYGIAYGVELEKNFKNGHYLDTNGGFVTSGEEIYGAFIGSSSEIYTLNVGSSINQTGKVQSVGKLSNTHSYTNGLVATTTFADTGTETTGGETTGGETTGGETTGGETTGGETTGGETTGGETTGGETTGGETTTEWVPEST